MKLRHTDCDCCEHAEKIIAEIREAHHQIVTADGEVMKAQQGEIERLRKVVEAAKPFAEVGRLIATARAQTPGDPGLQNFFDDWEITTFGDCVAVYDAIGVLEQKP